MKQKILPTVRKVKVKSLRVATLLTFAFFLSTVSLAQTSVNATGGNATGSDGSVSYSIGQVTYQTHTGTSGSMAEGVQQPCEISIVTGIKEAKGINLSVSAYPNPTTDYLTLSIDENVQTNYDLSQLSYHLFDMHGNLLQKGKMEEKQTSIEMGQLASTTYFVKIMVKSHGNASLQEIKTFKIIKNE